MKNKFTKEQEKEITLRYINGEKSTDLSKEFNCAYATILNIVKRNGGQSKSNSEAHTIYHCNDNYFSIIDSEDKAYFLGLLYSDGCIHDSQSRFLISLQEEDKYILELFKEKIKYTGYLYLRPSEIHKNQYSLEITSKKLKDDLKEASFGNKPVNTCSHLFVFVAKTDLQKRIGRPILLYCIFSQQCKYITKIFYYRFY